MVAVDGAHHPRPGAGHAEQSGLAVALEFVAALIDQHRFDAEERQRRRTRLHLVGAGQTGQHVAAGLRLPVGIDD